MLVRVSRGTPEEFIERFGRALDDLMAVAVLGSDAEQVEDVRLVRFREFFRPPLTAEESARELRAWRGMSESARITHERTARWDLGNVLHMLEPYMREWHSAQVEVTGPDTVEVVAEGDEMDAARGVIRQVVEFAGGKLLDEPKPEQ